MPNLTDRLVLLAAFVIALAAIVALVVYSGADAVKSLEIVPLLLMLGGALAGITQNRP